MRLALAAALLLLPASALAGPPAGWEEAPALPAPPPKGSRPVERCGSGAKGETCRQRQRELDEDVPLLRLERSLDLPLAKLAQLAARKGARGGPALTDAPTLVLRDREGKRGPFKPPLQGISLGLPFGRGRIGHLRTACVSKPACAYSFAQAGVFEEASLHPIPYAILDVAPDGSRVVFDEVEADVTLLATTEAGLVRPQTWQHAELPNAVPDLPVFAGASPDELLLVLPDGFVFDSSADARLDPLGFEHSWGDAPLFERVGLPIDGKRGRFVRFSTTGSAKLGKTEDDRWRLVHVEHTPATDGAEAMVRIRVLHVPKASSSAVPGTRTQGD